MKKIKAVAFDIDGTLYPNSRMYLASTGFALKNFSLLRRFRAVRAQLRKLEHIDDFYQTQAELLAQELGQDVDETRALIDRTFYGDWERVLEHVNLYPGVIELLSVLKERQLPLGVLSDFPVVTKLTVLNIENYFDVELSSEVSGRLKPHARPFELLIEQLGVDAADILYVGNSYEYDIVGAHAAGMQTAHITRRAKAHSLADFSFSRYAQLKDWLIPRI